MFRPPLFDYFWPGDKPPKLRPPGFAEAMAFFIVSLVVLGFVLVKVWQ